MADPFDDIDPGQDFEDFAVGLAPVTVARVDPDTGAALETVGNVPATKLVRRRGQGGEPVPSDTVDFVFRASQLGFLPKPDDTITDAGGTVWVVQGAGLEGFDALCRATCVIKR